MFYSTQKPSNLTIDSARQALLSVQAFNKILKKGILILILFLSIPCYTIGIDEISLDNLPDDTSRVMRLLELGETYCSVENDKALTFLQEAFTIATKDQYSEGIGRSLMWQGRVYYYKDDYALANKYFDMAEPAIKQAGDKEAEILLYFFRGEVCKLRGDFINAMSNYKQVLEITLITPNKKISSASYIAMGNILMSRKNPANALAYFREGLYQKKEINDEYGIACVMSQFGKAYEMLEDYDSSLYYYTRSLEIREKLDITRVIASSKYALSGLLILMKRYNEAIEYLEDARRRFEEVDEKTGVFITNYRLSKAMSFIGDPAGLVLAISTQEHASNINNPILVSLGYQTLAEIYLHQEQYSDAFFCLSRHKHIEDSLFSAEKERFMIEFEQKFQSEQKDNEITLLHTESKIQRQNILLLSICSATLLIILVLLYILFRYKSLAFKKSALLLEQEKIIHTQESKIRDNENQKLQDQLEVKNRELASKALEMIRYNDNIKSILEKLDEIYRNPDISDEVSTHIRSIINELDKQNKQNIWSEFNKIFKNIHSGFYTRLLEQCPDLTPTEIKTAALLKLNLTTKEIAAISYKSEGGIKTTRYRLRKKLGLSSDDKLVPFLIQI